MNNLPLTNKNKFTLHTDEEIRKRFNLELRCECFWLTWDKKRTVHFKPSNRVGIMEFEGILIEWQGNPFNINLDLNYVIYEKSTNNK